MTIRPGKLGPIWASSGMTLLEILLAMLVLSMVVSMVSLSLSGSMNVVNATRVQGELYYRAQVALERISEDLASALLVDGVEFIGEEKDIDGLPANNLSFTSMAHIVFDQQIDHPGIAYITYTVEADGENDGEFLLRRSDDLLATTEAPDLNEAAANGFLLSDRLRSVKFTFIDEMGEEHENWNTFVEEGADKSLRRLPVSVRCTLEYWIDKEEETSIRFSTGVLLPVGLINVKSK